MWTIEEWIELGKNYLAPAIKLDDNVELTKTFLELLDTTSIRWRNGDLPAKFIDSGMKGLFCGYLQKEKYPRMLSYCSFENTIKNYENGYISIYDFVEISGIPDIEDFEEFLIGDL